MNLPLPPLEPRLRERYRKLVQSHSGASLQIAHGIHAVPGTGSALSAAQAAYRFFSNDRISLAALCAPLIELAQAEVPQACDRFVLAVHDWSQLMYVDHDRKVDRLMLSSKHVPEGYEILTTLLVSDREGVPIAPVALSLQAADGVHCSRSWKVRAPLSVLDELDPAMTHVEQLSLGRPVVHLVDAEADSVAHYRLWSTRPERSYLVRADDRLVEHEGCEKKCSKIQAELAKSGGFVSTREVSFRGRPARQFVAEAHVVLTRPGHHNRPGRNDRRHLPGPRLPLRLIIAEVRSQEGARLATWYLLTNLPPSIDAATVAQWYYWRWSIEKFFKLLKSAGIQLEAWQQTSAGAIARRLLIACMACVVVWRLARSKHPQAQPARALLCRLSGRQIKRSCLYTIPAMLAGLWTLLAMLDILENHTLEELTELSQIALHPPPHAS